MAFFTTLSPFFDKGTLRIVVMGAVPQQSTGDPHYHVSVHLEQPCGDAAALGIPPFVLHGTVAELEAEFLPTVTAALAAKVTVVDSMEAFMAQLDRAKRESQVEKQREQQEQKTRTEKEKAFDKVMKVVEELETTKDYRKALGKLPLVTDFPDEAETIKKRRDELLAKLTEGSLFTTDNQ